MDDKGLDLDFKTVWISDLHLGSRACKAELLRDFLKEVKTEKLYLVGDIVDGWALKQRWYWPQAHNEVVRKLLKIAKRTKVIYIPGNHDESARSYCPLKFGDIEMKTWDLHTTQTGKRLVVLHGDIFDVFVTKSQRFQLFGTIAYDFLIWLNNLHHWLLERLGKRYWSLADFVKSKTKEALKAVKRFESAAMQYAKNKRYDGVVCGHIHQQALHVQDGITYINDGDWVESCTLAYEDHDGNLGIIDWAQLKLVKEYSPANNSIVEYA